MPELVYTGVCARVPIPAGCGTHRGWCPGKAGSPHMPAHYLRPPKPCPGPCRNHEPYPRTGQPLGPWQVTGGARHSQGHTGVSGEAGSLRTSGLGSKSWCAHGQVPSPLWDPERPSVR